MARSMVLSRQRRTSGTEAIFFREVLHRPLGGTRFFQHVDNNIQPVRAAGRDGGGRPLPTGTGSGHGWSMVLSRQRPTSWTEAIFFREVLHRPLGGVRFLQRANRNVQLARGAWYDGGGGARHLHTVH